MISKEKVIETIKKAFFNFGGRYGSLPTDIKFLIQFKKGSAREIEYKVTRGQQVLEQTNINEIIGIPKMMDLLGAGKKVENNIRKSCDELSIDLETEALLFEMKNAEVIVWQLNIVKGTKTKHELTEIIKI